MLVDLNSSDLKICFVSLGAYPLLTNKNLEYVGGAEVQMMELGKELNLKGYHISFITYGEKNLEIKNIGGINVLPVYDINKIDKMNLLKKTSVIWKKMKSIDADIYIHQAGSPGIISIFGMLNRKKSINVIASDADVTGKAISERNVIRMWQAKVGNCIDIKLSDIVISQNDFQKSMLKNKYKRNSIVIKNAFNIPPKHDCNNKDEYILWIGTIRSVKQPYLYLEIAKHFPENKFLMVGGQGDNLELFKKIKDDAGKIPNLDFKGFVPHRYIFNYLKRASILISTSKIEGFPNVFLEAWMFGVPVVSLTANPDGIITDYELGHHSKNLDQMIKDIKILLEDKEIRKKMGKNGRKYVEKYHNINNIANQYETLIKNIMNNKK